MNIAPHPPAWAACLAVFQRELTPQQYATWIRPLACCDEDAHWNSTILTSVPDEAFPFVLTPDL